MRNVLALAPPLDFNHPIGLKSHPGFKYLPASDWLPHQNTGHTSFSFSSHHFPQSSPLLNKFSVCFESKVMDEHRIRTRVTHSGQRVDVEMSKCPGYKWAMPVLMDHFDPRMVHWAML